MVKKGYYTTSQSQAEQSKLDGFEQTLRLKRENLRVLTDPLFGEKKRTETDLQSKVAQAERSEDVYPQGIDPALCWLSHTRPVWRLESGRAVLVAQVPAGQAQIQLRFGPLRALADAGLEGFGRGAMIGALQPQIAHPEPCVFPFRIPRQQFSVQPLRVLFFALLFEHAGKIVVHVGQIQQDMVTFKDETKKAKVEVELQNHPLMDPIQEKLDKLKARKKGEPNPFVVGPANYQKFVDVMSACTEVNIARRKGA